MTEPKLVAAPPPIAPQEILKLAKEGCLEYVELAFPNDSKGAHIFRAMSTAVIALTESGNVAAVNNAVYSMVEWCENYDKEQPASKERVEQAVARLKKWVQSVYALMEPLQEEKNDIDDLQQQDSQFARYVALQRSISELAALAEPVEKSLAKVEHYLSSLLVVERGLSEDALNMPLSALPEFVEVTTPEPVVSVPETDTIPVGVSPDRFQTLRVVANTYNLLAIQVLVFSLYDLFGPHNAVLGNRQRGLMRVLQTAHDMGILQCYGWPTVTESLKGSHWKDVATEGFLLYHGTFGGRGPGTFVRTEKVLPWDIRTLFTEKEAARFVAFMKAPAQRKGS